MFLSACATLLLAAQTYLITNAQGLHEVDSIGHVVRTITQTPTPQARIIPNTELAMTYRKALGQVVGVNVRTGQERLFARVRIADSVFTEKSIIQSLSLHTQGGIQLLPGGAKACIHLGGYACDQAGFDIEVDIKRRSATVDERFPRAEDAPSPCSSLGVPFEDDPVLKSLDGTAEAHLGPQQRPAYHERSTSPSGRWTLFWQYTSMPRACNAEEVTKALYLRDNSSGAYHIIPPPGEPWPPIMRHDDMKLREDPNAGYWMTEEDRRVNTPQAFEAVGTELPQWIGKTDTLAVGSVLIEPGVRTVDLGGRIVH